MAATQFPNFLAGMAPAATLLGDAVPWTDVKPSDQSVTSSTTLVNDNDLRWAVSANTTWFWVCFISYEGGTQGSSDLKFQWSLPSGATLKGAALAASTAGTLTLGHMSGGSTRTAGSNGAGTNLPLVMCGTVTVSSTGGSVIFQWAQSTSSGTATKVHAGSGLLAVEVS